MPNTDRSQPARNRTQTPDVTTWAIHIDKSRVQFRVRGMLGHWVRGTLPIRHGAVRVAGAGSRPVSVKADLDPTGVTTGNDKRDQHLRSADFFDVASTPTWSYVSTSIRAADGGWQVDGSLTLGDATRPVTLAVQRPDDSGRIVATTTVDRRDFDVTWGPRVVVGHQVHVTIEVELIRLPESLST